MRTEEDRRSSLPSLKAKQTSLLLASRRCPRPHVPASSTAPSVPASSVPVAELPAGCLLRFRLRRAPPASGASLLSFSLKMKLSVYREPDRLGGLEQFHWLFQSGRSWHHAGFLGGLYFAKTFPSAPSCPLGRRTGGQTGGEAHDLSQCAVCRGQSNAVCTGQAAAPLAAR